MVSIHIHSKPKFYSGAFISHMNEGEFPRTLLKSINAWDKEHFDSTYVRPFLRLMGTSQARQKLNELYIRDKRDERIALVCYCADENMCHRSIVAGLLQGAGCNVKLTSGADFSRYFAELKSILA